MQLVTLWARIQKTRVSNLAVIEVNYEKTCVIRTSDSGQGQRSDSLGTAVSVNCVLLSYICLSCSAK